MGSGFANFGALSWGPHDKGYGILEEGYIGAALFWETTISLGACCILSFQDLVSYNAALSACVPWSDQVLGSY